MPSGSEKEFHVNEKDNSDLPQEILHEGKYAFLNCCIRESGCKNVVDIACGFSPRGYVPAKELEDEDFAGTFRNEACDLTDPVKFEKLLRTIDGEQVIICEGLFMCLNPYEAQSLFEGIRKVLKQHGGKFITGDFMFSEIYWRVKSSLPK